LVEVGDTPLLEVEGIFAKLECTNPLGSIKDRMAKYILDESERRGLLRPGMQIIEASSGNTGISLSFFARCMGYPITIVMPRNMTEERKRIIRILGAKMILCSPGDFAEAAAIRDEKAEDPNYFIPDQFSNPLNVECHYKTTGGEILEQMGPHAERIDAFVAGVGTGGTLIGCGQRLREAFPDIKLVAVEPSESAVMTGGEPGIHGIQGIGDGFIPAIASNGKDGLHELIDDVVCISTEEAKEAAKYLSMEKGLCVGISSGANFLAAKQMHEKHGITVTIFPDGFSKYTSQGLKRSQEGPCPHHKECFCPLKDVCPKKDLYVDCNAIEDFLLREIEGL
jgi:cysteine synthase A